MCNTPHSPTRAPHKHAELIKAWADGAEIQYNIGLGWKDYDNPQNTPSWEAPKILFRVKPKTVKYRLYLDTWGNVFITSDKHNSPCNHSKWLGDWQEVEV